MDYSVTDILKYDCHNRSDFVTRSNCDLLLYEFLCIKQFFYVALY